MNGALRHPLANFPALVNEPWIAFDQKVENLIVERNECQRRLALRPQHNAIVTHKSQNFADGYVKVVNLVSSFWSFQV